MKKNPQFSTVGKQFICPSNMGYIDCKIIYKYLYNFLYDYIIICDWKLKQTLNYSYSITLLKRT